jgi:hypothetical protein
VSGQAGADIAGEHYGLFIGSGISVCIAPPRDDDGSAIGAHFDAASAPYHRWLARARPALDALFAEILAQGPLPLVALAGPCEQIDGTIVEDSDTGARHFAAYHRGGPLLLHAASNRHLPDGQSLNLRLVVATRVRRGDLDALLDRVAAVLLAHHAEPPPPPLPSPPAPVPAPGWVTRLRRWLRRPG